MYFHEPVYIYGLLLDCLCVIFTVLQKAFVPICLIMCVWDTYNIW